VCRTGILVKWVPNNINLISIHFQITLTGFMFLVLSALLGYLSDANWGHGRTQPEKRASQLELSYFPVYLEWYQNCPMPGPASGADCIYSPHLDSPPPRWVNFAHGLLLFLYQTFDAVDGKQARRTNSSSPLGELFDHGCDALACAFEALAFGSTAMCGRSTFWFWVISAIPFYGATWEHYFTNTLILPAINGPTEGLMLIYVVHFLTALIGAEWWAQQFGKSLPFLSWVPFISEIPTYGAVLFLMAVFAVIPTISFNVYNVYKVVQARKGSMLLALAMLYPFAVLLISVLVWDYLSPYNLMGNYPHLVVVGTGLAFGFLVGRMILAHLCDEPKGLKTNMCMSLLYLPLAIANALTARLNDGIPLVDESWVVLGYCVYNGMEAYQIATFIGTLSTFRHIRRTRNYHGSWDILFQDNKKRGLRCSSASFDVVILLGCDYFE
ncbi:hypothetical protein RJ639_002135, partial [Escallonia herrerae]